MLFCSECQSQSQGHFDDTLEDDDLAKIAARNSRGGFLQQRRVRKRAASYDDGFMSNDPKKVGVELPGVGECLECFQGVLKSVVGVAFLRAGGGGVKQLFWGNS